MDIRANKLKTIRLRSQLVAFSVLAGQEEVQLVLNDDNDLLKLATNIYYQTCKYRARSDALLTQDPSVDSLEKWLMVWVDKVMDQVAEPYYIHLEDFGELDWVEIIISKPNDWLNNMWGKLKNHSFCLANLRKRCLVVFSEEEYNFEVFYREF